MAKVGCLLLFLLTVKVTIGIVTLEAIKQHPTNLSLAEATAHIVRDYLSKFTKTVVVAENSILPQTNNTNEILFEYLLKFLDANVAVQLFMFDYNDQPWEYSIFIVDSLESFKDMYDKFTFDFYERHFRFLIVVTNYSINYRQEFMEIFKLCYRFDVFDVNIIVEHPSEGVCMYTYFHYSENVCRGFLPVVLYKFNEGFENFRIVFPEKFSNFHKCQMKVTTHIIPPYMTFEGNTTDPKSLEVWENLSALEGEILKLLAGSLNFTIHLLPFQTERSFVKNKQIFGCFLDLWQLKADIAIGCFRGSDPTLRIFSPTMTYHFSPCTYAIRAQQNVSAFGRLGRPFEDEIWILLVVLLILIVIFIIFLKHVESCKFVFGEENLSPVIHLFSMFLGYPVCRTPRRNFARWIFMLWLIFTLILRSAYQGSLYDAFRTDTILKMPKGYDDLIKSNFTFILPPEFGYAPLDIFPSRQVLLLDDDGFTPRLEMLERIEGAFATVAIQDTYFYHIERTYANDSFLYIIDEAVFNYQTAMFLPKHSMYLNVFNKKLKLFANMGILSKLRLKFTPNPTKYLTSIKDDRIVQLSNKHIKAVYYIYGAMMLHSIMVFGLELASVRYQRLQSILKLIT